MKIRMSKLQFGLEACSLAVLFGMAALLLSCWPNLPEQVPAHFNAAGEIDRWGGKQELLLLPAAGVMLWLLLTAVGLFPKAWNLPVEVTEQNRKKAYRRIRTLLTTLKLEVMVLFFAIEYFSVLLLPLPAAFLPASLAVLAVTLIAGVVSTVRAEKKK